MEGPAREAPQSRRARITASASAVGDADLSSLPDPALLRIFRELRFTTGLWPRPDLGRSLKIGAHRVQHSDAAALSQTCRRLDICYRDEFVTDVFEEVDFARAGQLLRRFPRATYLAFCRASSRQIDNANNEALRGITDIAFVFDHRSDQLTIARTISALSVACPTLKSLRIDSTLLCHTVVVALQGLEGETSLPHLELLTLKGTHRPVEIASTLRGRTSLLDLCISGHDGRYDPEVLAAVPDCIRRLRLTPDLGSFFMSRDNLPSNHSSVSSRPHQECLGAIGELPNLKDLMLQFLARTDWRRLDPAAARLNSLNVLGVDTVDLGFRGCLRRARNLRSLELLHASGNCASLLDIISKLPKLESLSLRSESSNCNPNVVLSLESGQGLLCLATGAVHRSLVTCCIELIVDDRHLRMSLLECFRERVEPLFEKPAVGSRELSVKGYVNDDFHERLV